MPEHHISCAFDRFKFSLEPVGTAWSGYAALWVSLLTCSLAGRPINKASPHTGQPHSGQSPSATSGQPPGSACICSKGRSSLHPVQYLVSCVTLDDLLGGRNTEVPGLKSALLPIVT
jgi:hypothetical protein